MKKVLLTAIGFASLAVNAQIVYSEDFEGADPLAGMTTYGTDGAVIASNGSLNATGLEDETFWVIGDEPGSNSAMTTSWFTSAITADNYLITPGITLSADESYKVTWFAESLGTGGYLDPYQVKISTTGTDKEDFTVTLFENTSGAPNLDGESIEVYLPTDYSGEEIYIAFVATGNDDYILTFDNIVVEQLPDNDIVLVSENLSDYVIAGDIEISGVVKNNGVNTITSFELDWNDGTAHPETITATIETGETYAFTHPVTLEATAGEEYSVEICARIESDENEDDNCLTKEFGAALDVADRLPLIELFTSSTCPPCYALNYLGFDGSGLNTGLANDNANDQESAELAVVKYQVNWPGSGDHSYNADVGNRVAYYSVGGAPSVFLDGAAPTGAFNSSVTNAAKEVPSYMDITATHSSAGGVLTVNVEVNPYISIGGATLHIALLDKSYEAGAGGSFSNGETEFHHVLRKMIPSPAGTNVSFTAGEVYSTTETYSYTFNSGFPSSGSYDLHASSEQEVVVFLQDADKNILNAAISSGDLASIEENDAENFKMALYPNPANATTTVNVSLLETSSVSIDIVNTLGEIVYTVAENNVTPGANLYEVDLTGFAAGIYTVKTNVDGVVKTRKLSVQ